VPEQHALIDVYYLFVDAGMEVVLAAPGGGSADGVGVDDSPAASNFQRFKTDRRARDVMNDLIELDTVCAQDFDAALWLGAPNLKSSTTANPHAGVLIGQLLAAAKPVAVIGGSLDYSSVDPAGGLLMIGNSNEAPKLAANSLLGAIGVGMKKLNL
jgi:putative intracellular protease/amidase